MIAYQFQPTLAKTTRLPPAHHGRHRTNAASRSHHIFRRPLHQGAQPLSLYHRQMSPAIQVDQLQFRLFQY